MATKERNQNPAIGDTIKLRLVTMNSNMPRNVHSVEEVNIYQLDPTLCCPENPQGRVLVETITDITDVDEGQYLIDLVTSAPRYVISKYIDVWTVKFREDDTDFTEVVNNFEIYPDLWYTSTLPAVYGFDFKFQPNRIRKGSIKWLIIKIEPKVPRATELERYYQNLAISSNLYLNIEENCGNCPPQTEGSLIVEDELVSIRDKVFGYYKLDTTEDGLDLDCGIYSIWFTLHYADSIDVSEKMQFQIY